MKQRRQLQLKEVPRPYRDLARDAIDAGFTLSLTRGMHIEWCAPDGVTIVHTASSPSDWRAAKNARRRMERAGLPKRR